MTKKTLTNIGGKMFVFEKIKETESVIRFSDLEVGQTFVRADSFTELGLNFEQIFVFMKISESTAIRLNTASYRKVAVFIPHTEVKEVDIIVQSVQLKC